MKRILKSSAIIGSGSLATIASGIIKSKVVAAVLGPSGMGMIALFQSVMNTFKTLVGMGLDTSGVRQIAAAKATGEDLKLASTRDVLWKTSLVLGLLGALVIIVFRKSLAVLSMVNSGYYKEMALLGVAVCALTISGAQTAFLNGMGRIRDLAKINVTAAVCSLIITIMAVLLWREKGIIIGVISAPISTLAASWWFDHKIKRINPRVSLAEWVQPLRQLLGLGLVLMVTAFLTFATQLIVRIMVTQNVSLEATGNFQAAWSISMLYLNFVLGAMGTDYYPRLTAAAHDGPVMNEMVNKQAEAGLLLAGPVILFMITFAPQLVRILYTGAFHDAVSVLRWQIIGDLFKVASWTLGFVFLALGRNLLFFFCELFWNGIYLLLIRFRLAAWGVDATGIAFLAAYACYFFLMWLILHYSMQFKWKRNNILIMVTFLMSAACIALAGLLGNTIQLTVGAVLTICMGLFAALRIMRSTRNQSL